MEDATHKIEFNTEYFELYTKAFCVFKKHKPDSKANISHNNRNDKSEISDITTEDILWFGVCLGREMTINS